MRSLSACFVLWLGILPAACVASASPAPSPAPTVTALPAASPTPTKASTATWLPVGKCAGADCLPVGDLPGWRQIFADDFEGSVPLGAWSGCSAKTLVCSGLPDPYRGRWWAYEEGWQDTSHNGVYSSARVLSIQDGVLDVYVHTEGGTHLVAAPLPLLHGSSGPLGQRYGRYAIRFRTAPLHGYKMAWLLWPDSETWPRDGEIDFPETNLDGTISAFLHRQGATAGNDQDAFFPGVPAAGGWHIAVTEWTADAVRFFLDGKLIGTSASRIPDTPMHWVIQTETNLDGYPPADGVEGHVQVDWVAAYAAD